MNNSEQHDLLTLYFSGEANQAEKDKLEQWRLASSDNQRLFEQFESLFKNTEPDKIKSIPDINESWQKLEKTLGFVSQEESAKIMTMPKFQKFSVSSLPRLGRFAWAIAATVILGLGTILYQFTQQSQQFQIVSTSYAHQQKVELPDGSLVTLNHASELQFAANDADSTRSVTLAGEAFFEIVKDHRPFIIHTNNAHVRVLGTKFGVWTREQLTRVTVQEGKVGFRALNADESNVIELNAGQMSFCSQENSPEPPEAVNTEQFLGWLEQKIFFRQTYLSEIIVELQRIYGVEIELENAKLGQKSVTATFHNKPIATVLASICLTLDLQYKREANKYVIYEIM